MRRIVPLMAIVLAASAAVAQAQNPQADGAVTVAQPNAREAQAQAIQAAGDAQLAQRAAGLAHDLLRLNTPSPTTWRQAAALLGAARKLDGHDPIYPQRQAEAMIHAGLIN